MIGIYKYSVPKSNKLHTKKKKKKKLMSELLFLAT